MKLLVFGATGPTGREVVAQAREQGHQVTGFSRAVQGDATDPAAVDGAVPGHDAVVSALGRRMSFRSENLIERSMRAIAPAMQRHGVRRLILVSACGVGDSAHKLTAEAYLRTTALEWTFVYPVGLTNGPRSGRYRAGERLELRGFPTISRADVAHFILTELRERSYARKIALVSY